MQSNYHGTNSLPSSPQLADGKRPLGVPSVRVQMVTNFPSASSPNLVQDQTFLSPRDNQPPRRRHSTDQPRRPSSAPPGTISFDTRLQDEYQRKSLTPITHSFQRDRTTSFADGASVGGPVKPSPLLRAYVRLFLRLYR